MTQLRGRDVEQVDGIWSLNLTPEAGTIKGNSARRVPVHPHLIEQGFIQFAHGRGAAPLFYRPRTRASENDVTQRKSPAAQARQRLAAWVRGVCLEGERVSPNHAWRHTFKQIGRRIANDETLLDYICGHAPATVGRAYGEPTLADMARVIEGFPRYSLV